MIIAEDLTPEEREKLTTDIMKEITTGKEKIT